MTSVKSAKLQLQSQPTQMLHKDEGVVQNNKSDDESQNDSSEEENQHIVNILFPQKRVKHRYMNQEAHTEEDSDIKGFLEEQIPGLYRARTSDEIYENSSEEESPENLPQIEADYYMNYSVSTGPGYMQMSRFEKVSYFQSLNAIYMAKMRTQSKKNPKQHFNKQNPEGDIQPQPQADKSKKNKKPAIRFNQIVCEVPFNKDQQPIAVRGTPEEQAFIVFDDEAYEHDYWEEEEEQQRIAREMLRTNKMRHMQKTQAYIDENEDESDSPDTLYNIERMQFLQELNDIQKYNGQGLDDEDDEEHVFFTDSEDQLLDFEHDEDQDDWPQDEDSFDEQLKENHRKSENKMMKQPQNRTLEWGKRKNWKRNHSRQFLEDDQNDQNDHQSSSGQQSSSSSSASSSIESPNQQADQSESPKSLQIVKPLAQIQNKKEQTVQQEPQFQEGIKGRKTNPNLLQYQHESSNQLNLHINGIQEVKQFPPSQTSQTSGSIVTENNQVLQTATKPQEQICQNTSEGQTIE